MSAAPLFSVIVVCRNPGARLHSALESVWGQRNSAFELVVIDGASTDGTREWLQSQHERIRTLVSEPDRGIYDAMNKGIARARGEWVYFLGADDRLAHDGVMAEVARYAGASAAAALAGEAAFDDGRAYRYNPDANPVARNFVHHQAAFYRRTLFEEHGLFDATLAIMADYEFNLRLLQHGVHFSALPLRIANCGTRGLSDLGSWSGYREEIAVRHRYFSALRCALWDAGSVARFLRKRTLRRRAR
jgi:putative colanic acid biosynthesis glycosyltransferase